MLVLKTVRDVIRWLQDNRSVYILLGGPGTCKNSKRLVRYYMSGVNKKQLEAQYERIVDIEIVHAVCILFGDDTGQKTVEELTFLQDRNASTTLENMRDILHRISSNAEMRNAKRKGKMEASFKRVSKTKFIHLL